jgi:hypothetical protein
MRPFDDFMAMEDKLYDAGYEEIAEFPLDAYSKWGSWSRTVYRNNDGDLLAIDRECQPQEGITEVVGPFKVQEVQTITYEKV